MTSISYCQILTRDDEDLSRVIVTRVSPFVDEVVLVTDDISRSYEDYLQTLGNVNLIFEEWRDNFSEYRNIYIRKSKCNWILVSDVDEHFNLEFLKNLRTIIKTSNNGITYNACSINSHDVELDENGVKVSEIKSNYYKLLLFKKTDGIRYEGTPHEKFIYPGLNPVRLPDIYYYEHLKTKKRIWRNATRNFFIAGGGNNEMPDFWKEWRNELKNRYGIDSWKDYHKYLKKGNIDSWLKDWMIKNRNKNDRPGDSEVRETFLYYFKALHPEEYPKELLNSSINEKVEFRPKSEDDIIYEKINNVYLKVLGRPVDADGLETYSKMLKSKALDEKRLEEVLMFSDEYKAIMIVQGRELKLPVDSELYLRINRVYQKVLKRSVDPSGYKTYSKLFEAGVLDEKKLEKILRNSDEYRHKFESS